MQELETRPDGVVFECACGAQVAINPLDLGAVVSCGDCGRYLRPTLQFLLVDQSKAPNLTVQCACGHFVVTPPDQVGKRATCQVCKRAMIMPQPVVKFDSPGVVRVPRKVLKSQLRRSEHRKERASKEMTRLESASHAGRITLRPGEHICVNLECGALLPPSANICPKCGTNRLTGRTYEGPGPEADPIPKWKGT